MWFMVKFWINSNICYQHRKTAKMNHQKRVNIDQLLIDTWYNLIKQRGYFDYWLKDYQDVESQIINYYPTISKTYIHNAFWKHVYHDKLFLSKYEY